MPNLKKSLALIYAVNPFGADHESTEHDPSYEEGAGSPFSDRVGQLGLHDPPPRGSFGPEKVRFVVHTQRYFSILDTVPLCHFCFAMWTMYDPNDVAELVRAATGWDVDLLELTAVGERRVNLLRAFDAREEAERKDDALPERCFDPRHRLACWHGREPPGSREGSRSLLSDVGVGSGDGQSHGGQVP